MSQGVLIVGERGTGKTSLALAIAAEAKVPVVEVKAQQLEAGLWVGQSASNVRELFQTARDLVGYSFISFNSILCELSVYYSKDYYETCTVVGVRKGYINTALVIA